MILKYNTPYPTVFKQWESMVTLVAHHGGSTYDQDKLTVYNIIIRYVADGSDAYTYVKYHIKRDEVRRDIKVIRGQ